MNLVPIQDAMDEILFEEFQFKRVSRVHGKYSLKYYPDRNFYVEKLRFLL